MNTTRTLLSVSVAACCLAGSQLTASAAVQTRADARVLAAAVTANFQMNESSGSRVMTDSSGNGNHGVINPDGVQSGYTVDGATGYHWVRRPPEQPPASPERVIQVQDDADLEPGDLPFTIELRYRTSERFGNITQKGQSTTRGGQWKIQNPQGIPSCVFKGSRGRVATGAKTSLNNNRWHTLRCVLTSTSVTMYVDGVLRNRKNGATGTIDNRAPMVVGGKINCDQIETTCDYFSGQIDYIRIQKG